MRTKGTENSKKRTFSGNTNNARFIDLSLSSTEEKSLKDAKVPRTTWARAYTDMLAGGLKVTLKVDTRTGATMCMIQDADYNPDVSPVIYVVRAGSAESVLLKAAWYWFTSDGVLPDPDADLGGDVEDDDIFA